MLSMQPVAREHEASSGGRPGHLWHGGWAFIQSGLLDCMCDSIQTVEQTFYKQAGSVEYLLPSYHSKTPKATKISREGLKMSEKQKDTEKEKWLELLQRMLERATAEQVKNIYIFALFSKY